MGETIFPPTSSVMLMTERDKAVLQVTSNPALLQPPFKVQTLCWCQTTDRVENAPSPVLSGQVAWRWQLETFSCLTKYQKIACFGSIWVQQQQNSLPNLPTGEFLVSRGIRSGWWQMLENTWKNCSPKTWVWYNRGRERFLVIISLQSKVWPHNCNILLNLNLRIWGWSTCP